MSVARCANPDCGREFRRLGTGRLYVRSLRNSTGPGRLNQKAAWLCDDCCDRYNMWFDRKDERFHLMEKKPKEKERVA